MALSLEEPVGTLSPCALIGENLQRTLNQSIQSLLTQIHGGGQDLFGFVDVFHRLMQSEAGQPLETIWIYSALSFGRRKSAKDDPLDRISMVKYLFQLISSCSSSCSPLKSIGLLAPVVFEVYELVTELCGKDVSSKRQKKAMREIKSLIDVILGYIGLCSSKNSHEETDSTNSSLNVPIVDLICVWTQGKSGFESFFPLISREICRKIEEEDSDLNCLSGVVVAEAFFLKLFYDISRGTEGAELENGLKNRVVGYITGLGNIHFFEILVNMLLEPELPGTSLLKSTDVPYIRKILWDAFILVEYSFLDSKSSANQPTERMRRLGITKLLLTHEAIEFCRENGDQKRAVSYSSAFSASRLPSHIIRWFQVGLEVEPSRPNGFSPTALIRWLLDLEKQGINVFEDGLLKRRAKLAIDYSRGSYSHFSSRAEEEKADADFLFYIDDKGDEEEEEEDEEKRVSHAFVSTAHSMKLSANGGKKRKERGSAGKKNKSLKYLKHDLPVASDSRKDMKGDYDGSSRDSEPLSDDE